VNFPKDTVIYLSGPISLGDALDLKQRRKYLSVFQYQDERLTGFGYTVLNPCTHPPYPSDMAPYTDYLRKDLALVSRCEVVAVLPDFLCSKGSMFECHVAHFLGIPVLPAQKIRQANNSVISLKGGDTGRQLGNPAELRAED
jgi:hypothetical protein